jgi:hypothetical protein
MRWLRVKFRLRFTAKQAKDIKQKYNKPELYGEQREKILDK